VWTIFFEGVQPDIIYNNSIQTRIRISWPYSQSICITWVQLRRLASREGTFVHFYEKF